MDKLASSDIVVTISAGNSGAWPTYARNSGYLYADDVSMQTAGTPGTYTNPLTIASADNAGATGAYFTVGDTSSDYVFFIVKGKAPQTSPSTPFLANTNTS